MSIVFRSLGFAGEVSDIDLRETKDRTALEAIRAGMDKHAVLVFRDQKFSDAEQLAFAERFDGDRKSVV